MNIGNKLLTKALLGIVLGIIIGAVFWFVFSTPEDDSRDLILHLAMSGLFGMVSMGGSVVYDIESWGVLKTTATHYVLCMGSFSLVSTALKWFPDITSFFIMFAIMTVVYAGIWLFEYLYWKKTIKDLNEQLKKIHEVIDNDEQEEGDRNE
ncbi:MAG: DUF3021 domain-containing protein [Lachnospiraceae bacterium]|nr:DUF3021 domain-containing protein [Lachnospiraceae bacterium]